MDQIPENFWEAELQLFEIWWNFSSSMLTNQTLELNIPLTHGFLNWIKWYWATEKKHSMLLWFYLIFKRPLILFITKACIQYFSSNFYFSPNDSPTKTMKNFLFHLQSSFRSQDIQVFVFLSSPLSFSRDWSKINLKVYKIINCLSKKLNTFFFYILRSKKGMTLKLCLLIEH